MGNDLILVAQIAVKSSAAVLLAALGEVLSERGGVLNLGLEGMMLAGALAGFAVGAATGDPLAAAGAAVLAGMVLASLHALFVVGCGADQVLSGLAVGLLGVGATGFLGRAWIGRQGLRLPSYDVPLLADIPALGDVFFRQPPLVYAAYVLLPLVCWILSRTRFGLAVRASGENAQAADAAGMPVRLTRTLCVLFGGCLAGLAGAYLSLCYTPGWKDGMSAGQGYIAIAMVVFAGWRPARVAVGALLFGGLSALQFYFQVAGLDAAPVWVLRVLPYVLTLAVLAASNRLERLRRLGNAPADLGRPFSREG
ncbi:ABC transporter permease [Desulfovibrio aminophilus]|uniref:ABC transporter permease n=1 Tax=Desulfovibrio aminophilus TaxID=81425 RepID=UPI003394EDCF